MFRNLQLLMHALLFTCATGNVSVLLDMTKIVEQQNLSASRGTVGCGQPRLLDLKHHASSCKLFLQIPEDLFFLVNQNLFAVIRGVPLPDAVSIQHEVRGAVPLRSASPRMVRRLAPSLSWR